jgi:hypothetical protein
MKLKKSIRLNGQIIPKGTVLNFGTENFTMYKNTRIAKSQIPEAAIESVSQKRQKGSVLAKSIRLGKLTIPAGESLVFDAEGNAQYAGETINIYQIPSRAFVGAEPATESKQIAKTKMPVAVNGTVIPAGESLVFNGEGMADYQGKQISIYDIPSAAFESVNNLVDTEKEFKSFDALEPGDLGIGQDGSPVRFLGKATGKAGYDALVGQFGNASGQDFDVITAGIDPEKLDETQFVAYTIEDGTVCVGIYGEDHVIATESDGEFVQISEVNSGDDAVDADGKPCTIIAKGKGTVWYDKMREATGANCRMEDIKKRLGITENDELQKEIGNADFVVIAKGKDKFIDLYGANGVKVFAAKED